MKKLPLPLAALAIAISIALAIIHSSSSSSASGKVVGVSDGDTITVLKDNKPIKVRLSGVDCPESHQAFGAAAKKFTSDQCFGAVVKVNDYGKDRYGRAIAEVILPDGRSLNRELIKAGYAWHYKQYSKDRSLTALEAEARNERRGLWADAHSVAPWDFRHGATAMRKSGGSGQSGGSETGTMVSSADSFADSDVESDPLVYRTGKGEKYHNEGCSHLSKDKNSLPLSEAKKLGLSACKTCKAPQ